MAVKDAEGIVTRYLYDRLGRRTFLIENHANFTWPISGFGDGTDNEDDLVTKWEYNGLSGVTKLTAYNAGGTSTQETETKYASSVDASWVTLMKYPDGNTGGSDNVQTTYHTDGTVNTRKDQRGTVLTFSYLLFRLKNFDEGTLVGTSISGTPKKEEDWTLDALGNWTAYVQKTNGTTDLNQTRSHNDANEVGTIGATVGTNWADPTHDNQGNTTLVPKPSSPASGYTLKYDAWNRLVEVKDGAAIVCTFEYDGRNYRIQKVAGGVTYDYYYNESWQCLEVRKNAAAFPLEALFWGTHYVDALAVRFWNSNGDTDFLDAGEIQYYSHDANYNVTGVYDTTGTVTERYQYTPYGELKVLDANFANDADGLSDFANTTTFTGRLLDTEYGQYYFRNRNYGSGLGRFGARDPVGYEDGLNLYAGYFAEAGIVDPFGLAIPGTPVPGTEFRVELEQSPDGTWHFHVRNKNGVRVATERIDGGERHREPLGSKIPNKDIETIRNFARAQHARRMARNQPRVPRQPRDPDGPAPGGRAGMTNTRVLAATVVVETVATAGYTIYLAKGSQELTTMAQGAGVCDVIRERLNGTDPTLEGKTSFTITAFGDPCTYKVRILPDTDDNGFSRCKAVVYRICNGKAEWHLSCANAADSRRAQIGGDCSRTGNQVPD